MFSPTVYWNGVTVKRPDSEVRILQIYSYGMSPCNVDLPPSMDPVSKLVDPAKPRFQATAVI
jgi:hypothetical protein